MGRNPVSFVAYFFALAVTFMAIAKTETFRDRIGDPSLGLNASVASGILTLVGEEAAARGRTVRSPRFNLKIGEGCDAVRELGVMAAAVLASPVSITSRIVGAIGGGLALIVLNQLRIVSLYFIGVYSRTAFEIAHRDVWQALFIISSLVIWLIWARWSLVREGRIA